MGSIATNVNLTALVRTLTGSPGAEIATVREERFEPNLGSATTGGLRRVSGTTRQGQRWSFFVKSIHSPKHWPMIGMIPEHLRADFIAGLPWRAEVEAYQSAMAFPDGLRRPELHVIEDLGDDRLELWLEDIENDSAEWDLARYERAAYLLGGLAARNPAPPPPCGNLRYYVEARIVNDSLPMLRDPVLWEHPLIASHADPQLRADLLTLGGRAFELLDAADRLPHSMVHGDSSPHNLMVGVNGEFVAIDWGWYCSQPIGFDLGQLLVGLAHDGLTRPEDLPKIHATIEAAYLRGLEQGGGPSLGKGDGVRLEEGEPALGEGCGPGAGQGGGPSRGGGGGLKLERGGGLKLGGGGGAGLGEGGGPGAGQGGGGLGVEGGGPRFGGSGPGADGGGAGFEGGGALSQDAIAGYRITVVLRSAFTAIPFERLDEPVTPELTEIFRRRVRLARFLADLGLALPGGGRS